MSLPHRTRLVNPRLGTYFGIFASAYIGLFLVLLILEQLETGTGELRMAVLLGPLLLFAGIGAASFTMDSGEYFAAGRRVPAVYNGLVLATAVLGATGLVTMTGLFFLNGFDAWCLAIGIFAGFVGMGTAVAPYLRKYGAYTVPSYLSRRFGSRMLRLVAAAVFAVPMLLLLVAELKLAVYVARLLTGFDEAPLAVLFGVTTCAMLIFGGMRALGWVSTAQAIAALISVIVPAAMIGVMLTNLPLAQLSHGPVLRAVGHLEFAQQIAVPKLGMLDFNLAGQGLEPVLRRFATPFGSIGWLSFMVTSLVVAIGVSCAPWLLPRCGTTLGVYESRKSLGWAIFFTGATLITLSAMAVFMRDVTMRELVGRSADRMPEWFGVLRDMGLADTVGRLPQLPLSGLAFTRDGIVYALPLAMGFPVVVIYLALAGAVAAALAAIAATAFSLAAIFSEDGYIGLRRSPPRDMVRVTLARIGVVVAVLLGLAFSALVRADPLNLFLAAMSLSAATAFPAVVMSIWWKRINTAGAVAAMLTGFGVAMACLLSIGSGVVTMPIPLAGLAAVPLAIMAGTAVSLITPLPNRAAMEAARVMRIPGGETVYDREMRLLRFSQRERARP